MKKILAFHVIAMMVLGSTLWAQRGTARLSFGGKSIEIEYGRPSLQGRDMISRLPVGETWSMGMNAATTLRTEATLKFGDKAVEPGRYRLTARKVDENHWQLLINHDGGSTVVPLSGEPASSVETFTIELQSKGESSGHLSLAWGTIKLETDFTVK